MRHVLFGDCYYHEIIFSKINEKKSQYFSRFLVLVAML